MTGSTLHIRQLPHFRLHSAELAKWLDQQPEDSWWSVDGDPLLTERLDFPCPPDELAGALRKVNGDLLLLDSRDEPSAKGDMLTADQLDAVAYIDEHNDRVFQLSWEGTPETDWILIEDRETGESSLALDDAE
ncbi:MAG: hypothetical protein WD847_17585 [Pirellulales bacterium]